MGRVTRRVASVQVTSRLTWTFSVRAVLGRARGPRPRRALPVAAANRLASAALLRSVMRAAGARPHPVARRAVRVWRPRRGR
ncbi:hypothetical protein [Streptomyces sp. NPDC086787]|uniref:hypothetical protein n=1 Tax=Streptomyces sp. NPDC086787 TaxID=3365759 RepID=UPI0037F3A2D4